MRPAAEIRNPYTKERHWLGTFGSAEEAALAYDISSDPLLFLGLRSLELIFFTQIQVVFRGLRRRRLLHSSHVSRCWMKMEMRIDDRF